MKKQANAAKMAEEIEGGTESGGSIHVTEECKQEVDRKTDDGKEPRSGHMLWTVADVANKAMGAAGSDADPPLMTAKDESKQPSSNKTPESSLAVNSAATTPGTLKAAEPTPQHPLKDGSSAGQEHHEKGQPSAAAEAASSKVSSVVGSTGTSHEPGT